MLENVLKEGEKSIRDIYVVLTKNSVKYMGRACDHRSFLFREIGAKRNEIFKKRKA